MRFLLLLPLLASVYVPSSAYRARRWKIFQQTCATICDCSNPCGCSCSLFSTAPSPTTTKSTTTTTQTTTTRRLTTWTTTTTTWYNKVLNRVCYETHQLPDTAWNNLCRTKKPQRRHYSIYTYRGNQCIAVGWDDCKTPGSNNFRTMASCTNMCARR